MFFTNLLDRNNLKIDQKDQRFYQLILLITLSSFIISCVILLYFSFIGVKNEILFYLCLFSGSFLLLYFLCRHQLIKASFYGLLYQTFMGCMVGIILLGWRSGLILYLFILIPAIMFNTLLKKIELYVVTAIYCLFLFFCIYLCFTVDPVYSIGSENIQHLSITSALLTGLILTAISLLDKKNSELISKRLIEANEQLTIQASHDPLTNLINRRRMNELIEMESVRSKRSEKPFGIIMADVDDFKKVNDVYGHPAGDYVLVQLANLLASSLRKQDIIARWGGEEFLVLLPETELSGTLITAEKLREIVAHTSFSFQGNLIQVTVTFGSVICESSEDWDSAIKKADGALYYGKHLGKNITISADDGAYEVLEKTGELIRASSPLNSL